MASELGDALDHAHSHGVVHRDVKPGERAAARGRRHEARRPRDRHGRRPDPDHPQRHRARHRRLHGARAARRRRGGPGRPTCTRSPPSASRRSPAGKARTGRTPMEIARAIATEPPPDLRDHLPGAPPAAADAAAARARARPRRSGRPRPASWAPGSGARSSARPSRRSGRAGSRRRPPAARAALHGRRPLLVALAAAAVARGAPLPCVLRAVAADDERRPPRAGASRRARCDRSARP